MTSEATPRARLAVARGLREILLRPELVGTFHLTCEGEASWYEFACKIFEIAGNPQKVIPCTSDEYKTPARRPGKLVFEKKDAEALRTSADATLGKRS